MLQTFSTWFDFMHSSFPSSFKLLNNIDWGLGDLLCWFRCGAYAVLCVMWNVGMWATLLQFIAVMVQQLMDSVFVGWFSLLKWRGLFKTHFPRETIWHPILSYPILSYPILSYPILSYPNFMISPSTYEYVKQSKTCQVANVVLMNFLCM